MYIQIQPFLEFLNGWAWLTLTRTHTHGIYPRSFGSNLHNGITLCSNKMESQTSKTFYGRHHTNSYLYSERSTPRKKRGWENHEPYQAYGPGDELEQFPLIAPMSANVGSMAHDLLSDGDDHHGSQRISGRCVFLSTSISVG